MKKTAILFVAVVLAAIVQASVPAGPKDPIAGVEFERWAGANDVEFQGFLGGLVGDSGDYTVAGPLDPTFQGDADIEILFHSQRVICRNSGVFLRFDDGLRGGKGASMNEATRRLSAKGLKYFLIRDYPWRGEARSVLVTTYQEVRWLIWYRDARAQRPQGNDDIELEKYSQAISQHLWTIDELEDDDDAPVMPTAKDYGLPEEYDFYPPKPDYVIQGYQNYKDYLEEHADIETFFADGILAFVPSDSLLDVVKTGAPAIAWPNKEAPLVQHEYKKFFDRDGDVRVMNTLTADVLANLAPGEYFYAVGFNGKIRFAREIPREEIEKLESETGKKVPRANHAFLFPGEPVLTAGAFFVERQPAPEIAAVNTHSGHYFYSNVSETIRDDIAKRSDDYLLTIGHFFNALDAEGIPYDGILISKM